MKNEVERRVSELRESIRRSQARVARLERLVRVAEYQLDIERIERQRAKLREKSAAILTANPY